MEAFSPNLARLIREAGLAATDMLNARPPDRNAAKERSLEEVQRRGGEGKARRYLLRTQRRRAHSVTV